MNWIRWVSLNLVSVPVETVLPLGREPLCGYQRDRGESNHTQVFWIIVKERLVVRFIFPLMQMISSKLEAKIVGHLCLINYYKILLLDCQNRYMRATPSITAFNMKHKRKTWLGFLTLIFFLLEKVIVVAPLWCRGFFLWVLQLDFSLNAGTSPFSLLESPQTAL